MRAAALAVLLALATGPAPAQVDVATDPFLLIDGLTPYMEADDIEGAWRHLDRGIHEARRSAALTPDWALVFAVLADSIRNIGENPLYALRIVDEGLELARQGGPAYAEEAAALEVSRAYALADLGRFDEAVTAATLALPALRARFGDAAADDLAGYVQDWARGDLTIFNTSALTLARRALDAADAAFDRGDHVAALTAAARADLPQGAGFDPVETALLRAEARALSGRALFLMGRRPEAIATLDEGAGTLLEPGWQAAPPRWRVAVPDDAVTRARLTELFFWRARGAVGAGDHATATAALRLAEGLNDRPEWRATLLMPQVQMAQARGDALAADALLARAGAEAEARGDAGYTALMAFYRATSQAAMAPTWDAVDLPRLLRATEAALAAAGPGSVVDPAFVRTEAATFLVGAGAHAEALRLLRAIDRPGDLRTDHQRSERRRQAETHLSAAHAIASRDPGALCPDVPGMGCAVMTGAFR